MRKGKIAPIKNQRSIESFFMKVKPKQPAPPPVKEEPKEVKIKNEIDDQVPSSPIAEQLSTQPSNPTPIEETILPTIPIHHKIKRTISTPNWILEEQNMRMRHFQIELNERDYLRGIKQENPLHISKSVDTNNLDESEMHALLNYKVQLEENVVPTFWPPRKWDSDFVQLSREESDNLQEKIQDSYKEAPTPKPKTKTLFLPNLKMMKAERNTMKEENKAKQPPPENIPEIKTEKINENILDIPDIDQDLPEEPIETPTIIEEKKIKPKITSYDFQFSDQSEEQVSAPAISRSNSERFRNPIIYFSTKYFDTDDDDENTDLEDI